MAYIGNAPVLQSTEFREEFFPSSNQSAFTTGGFHPNAVSVYRNGVLLAQNGDYSKGTDNVTITLNSAAVSGDVVVIRGNRSLAQGVSVSESRVEYTWQSGDTVVQLNADVIPAYTDVYLNGVKLAAADYSINASTKQVSFTSAPAVGDVIAVVHKNETSALVALPLKDSAGNNVLSEADGVVTLNNAIIASSNTNNIDVIGFSKSVYPDQTSTGVVTYTATNAFINGMTESSGTITIQTAGKYFAYANLYVSHSSTSTHYMSLKVRVNTTDKLASGADNYNSSVALRGTLSVGGIITVAVNDTVDFYVTISGSGTVFNSTVPQCTLFYLGQ